MYDIRQTSDHLTRILIFDLFMKIYNIFVFTIFPCVDTLLQDKFP